MPAVGSTHASAWCGGGVVVEEGLPATTDAVRSHPCHWIRSMAAESGPHEVVATLEATSPPVRGRHHHLLEAQPPSPPPDLVGISEEREVPPGGGGGLLGGGGRVGATTCLGELR